MGGFELGVCVPLAAGAVVDLHEANAAFDEAASEQAEAAHHGGFFDVEAVEAFGFVGFLGEVDGFGGGGLHAEGEFVAAHAGVEFGLVGVLVGEAAVHAGEEIELAALLGVGDLFGGVEVGDGLGAALDANPLVDGGHEAGGPVARSVDDLAAAVLHNDEGGEVGV